MCLPGGVGTLDETFELLTLTQTGKGMPVPIVLLDEPGDPYWEAVDGLMQQLVRRGLVSAGDTALYTITDSCDEAWRIIDKFYANYDSIRFVGDHMVMRMQHGLTDAQLADLNERYGHFIVDGTIHRASRTRSKSATTTSSTSSGSRSTSRDTDTTTSSASSATSTPTSRSHKAVRTVVALRSPVG